MPGGLQVEFLEDAPAEAAIPQLVGDPYAIAGLWAAFWLLALAAVAVVLAGRAARDLAWRNSRDARAVFALLKKTRYFIQ